MMKKWKQFVKTGKFVTNQEKGGEKVGQNL